VNRGSASITLSTVAAHTLNNTEQLLSYSMGCSPKTK